MAIQLDIFVADPTTILIDFNVIQVSRSITGSSGPYTIITALTAKKAEFTSTTEAPFLVSGNTLFFKLDGVQKDVTFTGSVGGLTAAEVVSQINTKVGATVASVSGQKVKLSSTASGTVSSVEITGGSAAAAFGWTTASRDVGEDAHIPIVSGTTLYKYTDQEGKDGNWYTVSYLHTTTGAQSQTSAPFQGTGTFIGDASLSTAVVDLVDGRGLPVQDQEISIYPVHDPLKVGAYYVGMTRAPVVVKTDSAGHASVSLVRGMRAKVVFEGTSFIKEITIPDAASFDLLALMGTAPDPFSVVDPNYQSAIRRSP